MFKIKNPEWFEKVGNNKKKLIQIALTKDTIKKRNNFFYWSCFMYHKKGLRANTVRSFLLLLNSQTVRIDSSSTPAVISNLLTASTFLRTPSSPTLLPSLRVMTRIPPGRRSEVSGRTRSRTESRTSRLASQINNLNI